MVFVSWIKGFPRPIHCLLNENMAMLDFIPILPCFQWENGQTVYRYFQFSSRQFLQKKNFPASCYGFRCSLPPIGANEQIFLPVYIIIFFPN